MVAIVTSLKIMTNLIPTHLWLKIVHYHLGNYMTIVNGQQSNYLSTIAGNNMCYKSDLHLIISKIEHHMALTFFGNFQALSKLS